MRILITGSTGFLGGSVGRFAALQGHEVIGIARRSQADPGWPGQHVGMDVALADLSPVIQQTDPDMIFHAAGTASVGGSFTSPLDDLRASTMTFANLLEGVRRSGKLPLVIFPSSAAVYGNPPQIPIREDSPANPISPYGFHKLACEMIAREYADCFGIETNVCRIFSVFGPAQRRLLVWEIFRQLHGPSPVVQIQGTGHESRDYLHVDDLAAALFAFAAHRPAAGRAERCRIFNLASGIETRISELAFEMCRINSPKTGVEFLNRQRPGDPTRWSADMSRTAAEIPNWKPRELAAGLAECMQFWQAGDIPANTPGDRTASQAGNKAGLHR